MLRFVGSLGIPVLLVALFIQGIFSVDRGNFKTCQDSGFCRTHRALPSGNSKYVVDPESLMINNTLARFDVANTQFNDVHFTVYVFSYAGNIIRVRMEERNPIRGRFEIPPGDVIIQEPASIRLSVHSKNDAGFVLLAGGDRRIAVHYKPFSINVFGGKDETRPFMRFNADGLLKYEHFRTRGGAPVGGESRSVLDRVSSWFSSSDSSSGDQQADATETTTPEQTTQQADVNSKNEEGEVWEENFKTHEDKKQFGPSSVGADITFVGFDNLYGLPEHADWFRLKPTKGVTDPYRLYNLDVFEYELDNPMALYGSIPFIYAHSGEKSVGFLWLNPSETWVDVEYRSGGYAWTQFMSETGFMDMYIFSGPRPRDVFSQYASLVGTTQLPPLFSLAYHQCRWNYNDEGDVAGINEAFDQHFVPADVIWLDIEHTDGKRYFTWDKSRFPNSIEMINNLTAKGRRLVNIVDPHIKRDDNYEKYSELRSKGYFVKDRNGNDYDGWCWPGSSSWADFCNADVRLWWAEQFSLENYPGTTENVYIWNDMNEPSVFSGPEVTMHKDAQHIGGYEHREVHNMYGHYQVMATYNGLLKRSHHQKRPFILSRSFFVGSQRFAAVWTGDNMADWQHLRITTSMLLSLSISGITFCGADVGGFFKNPDAELLTRWYQAGAFHPFFREHAHIDTRRREPWLFDADSLNRMRSAIQVRYSYLPYWYTLFFENEHTGVPPMRPAWYEFPSDSATFQIEDSFMVGSAIFVHPIHQAGQESATFYLPGEGLWYRADEWSPVQGGRAISEAVNINAIPVFQRGGSIISRWLRPRRSSQAMHRDPLTLIACLDEAGRAEGRVFVDEFDGYQYKRGLFTYRAFSFQNNTFTSRPDALATAPVSSHFTTPIWIERVVLVGMRTDQAPVHVTISGPGIEKHNLDFGWDPQYHLLVIRRPGISVAANFDISLSYQPITPQA